MADQPPHPDSGDDTGVGSDFGPPPSTPRWVMVFGIAFLVLVLLVVGMLAAGHGPGRHMSHGVLAGSTLPSAIAEQWMHQP